MKKYITIILCLLFPGMLFAQQKAVEYREAGRTRVVRENNLQAGGVLPLDNLLLFSKANSSDTLFNINPLTNYAFTDLASGVPVVIGLSGSVLDSALYFQSNDSIYRAYDANIVPSTGSFTFTAFVRHGDVDSGIDILWTTFDNDTTGLMVFIDSADSLLKFMMSDTNTADTSGGGFGWSDADTAEHTSTILATDSAWHFIAITRDTTGATHKMILQIDGTSVSTDVDSATGNIVGDADAPFMIGNGNFKYSTGTQGWGGTIDNVTYWNTALSVAQLEYLRQYFLLQVFNDGNMVVPSYGGLASDNTWTGVNTFTDSAFIDTIQTNVVYLSGSDLTTTMLDTAVSIVADTAVFYPRLADNNTLTGNNDFTGENSIDTLTVGDSLNVAGGGAIVYKNKDVSLSDGALTIDETDSTVALNNEVTVADTLHLTEHLKMGVGKHIYGRGVSDHVMMRSTDTVGVTITDATLWYPLGNSIESDIPSGSGFSVSADTIIWTPTNALDSICVNAEFVMSTQSDVAKEHISIRFEVNGDSLGVYDCRTIELKTANTATELSEFNHIFLGTGDKVQVFVTTSINGTVVTNKCVRLRLTVINRWR